MLPVYLNCTNPRTVPQGALTPAQVGHRQTSLQKGKKRKEKIYVNNAVTKTVQLLPKGESFSNLSPRERQEAGEKRKKDIQRVRSQAITAAQRKRKADATARWEAAKLTPAQKHKAKADVKTVGSSTKPPGLTPEDRNQVQSALKNAGDRMQDTVNIPGRKDQFTVGKNKWSGNEVRKAILNSYLHTPVPVGHPLNRNPKDFRNDMYDLSHPDLAGQRPIPGNPIGLKEYPVIKNSPAGWNGGSAVGPGRVITSSVDGMDTFHGVVAHNPTRVGADDDHYLAKHKVGPRNKAKRSEVDDCYFLAVVSLGESGAN
ncbi:hypothetical protein Hypma_007362 [Hypsizygus marmoreus]|uniref:Uncharacterized protein n=1 Tax=Hypsizygus marmoreus TaxID=39966 RepID=A0A369JSR0_HYPMA|nr:hypothetical protein Hypma_007362 [Hypsizygus marmoreus]